MTRKGIGIEDKMHISFGQLIRQYEFYNKLDCNFWSYCPFGEYRTSVTGAMLKKKGTKKGVPDFMFLEGNQIIWLEFKTPTGKQSKEQKEFQEMCKRADNMFYYVVRSIEEGLKILKDHLIIGE